MRDRAVDFDPLRRLVGVLLQQGRVQVDADSDEYVRMRRFALAILQSLDQTLGLDLFEPAPAKKADPDWSDGNAHDPGITLLEVLAYAVDQLSAYADQVATEARLEKRRRVAVAVAAAGGILVVTAWRRGRRRP